MSEPLPGAVAGPTVRRRWDGSALSVAALAGCCAVALCLPGLVAALWLQLFTFGEF